MSMFVVSRMGLRRQQSGEVAATSSCSNAIHQAFPPGEWRLNRHARKYVAGIDAHASLDGPSSEIGGQMSDQLVQRNRVVADASTRSVVNGVRNRRRYAAQAQFADTLGLHR